jgi:peptidoglycan/xylan/chitin deacetylase (PgdA/CDA1 family)
MMPTGPNEESKRCMSGVLDSRAMVRLLGAEAFPAEAVDRAVHAAAGSLPRPAQKALAESGLEGLADAVLLEHQFGPDRFTLSRSRRLYYRMRPLFPAAARALLRRRVVSRTGRDGLLRWPVEDGFVSFVEDVRAALEESLSMRPLPWWPSDHSFAVVLTHDVEGPFGLAHLPDVLSAEREASFRSSVSLVGDTYGVPESLLRELRADGFEIALHGWRHDGRDFWSRRHFDERLPRMNQRLRQWDAVGFRSPMVHRNPLWMQGLDVAWDSSFFDTDPFQPMPGGVMSIWPYVMGRFVELPYTLPQDVVLIETLGENTPRIWLEKLDFIAAHGGMALVNTHPDYLCRGGRLAMYKEFLAEVARRSGYWHALPREVAAWTRARWRGRPSLS